jgi:hypothetical protein
MMIGAILRDLIGFKEPVSSYPLVDQMQSTRGKRRRNHVLFNCCVIGEIVVYH